MPRLPSGRALLDSEFILEESGLHHGASYADFGCGSSGSFLSSASRLVGQEGNVFAVDVRKFALEAARARAELEQLANVQALWADIQRSGGIDLPDESLDFISYVGMASVLKNPEHAIEETHRVLKPGGLVLVVDWKKGGGAVGPAPEERLTAEEARKLFESKEFSLKKSFQAGPHHWALLFEK